jgi:orotidine-5'-phosphate decarboxylase
VRNVIIACDFQNREEVMAFLARFDGEKPYLKIGMELFYGEGPDIVRKIKETGFSVFLDLKLHDIPNTVKKAMANIARLGVDMVNVHAAGTIAMMEAAREGLQIGALPGKKIDLIAVTQLTSTSQEVMQRELLIRESLEDTVARYAQNAKAAGLNGVVCSPLEVRLVKTACGEGFLTVTPGIRYPEGSADDQKRITTPQKARELGSDFIVVGRPITAARDPKAAWLQVKKDFLG